MRRQARQPNPPPLGPTQGTEENLAKAKRMLARWAVENYIWLRRDRDAHDRAVADGERRVDPLDVLGARHSPITITDEDHD